MISEENYNYLHIAEVREKNEDKYYLLGFQSRLAKAHEKNFIFLSKMLEMFNYESNYALQELRDIAWFSNISYDRLHLQKDQSDDSSCELESGWMKVYHGIEAIHIDASLIGESLYVDNGALSVAFIIARDKKVTVGRNYGNDARIHVFDRNHEQDLKCFHLLETKLPVGASVDFLFNAPVLNKFDGQVSTQIVLHITRVE